jgi:hypothetical protein
VNHKVVLRIALEIFPVFRLPVFPSSDDDLIIITYKVTDYLEQKDQELDDLEVIDVEATGDERWLGDQGVESAMRVISNYYRFIFKEKLYCFSWISPTVSSEISAEI